MDSFSVTALTSLCTSITNSTASSAAELDAFTKSTDPSATPSTLRSHQELLTQLRNEAIQLEQALKNTVTISQSLQETLHSILSTGDAAAGKLHKQLMRVQPQNVDMVDDDYITKYSDFLVAYRDIFRFLSETLLLTTRAEQDARILALGQQRLQNAENSLNTASRATSILIQDGTHVMVSNMSSMPLRPKVPLGNTDILADAGDQPPPYLAAAPTVPPVVAAAGPSNNSGPFASFSKSFKAFTSHFISKPDPLVSALCQAIIHGDTQQVGGLLGQGANINGRNEDGKTPVQCAIMTDDENVFSLLLSAGASPKGPGWGGMPPLFQAASAGKLRIARMMIEKGADVMEVSITGQPYFVDICEDGNMIGIEFMLQYGASANSETVAGRPVLAQAVKKDNIELATLLLNFGAKSTALDITGSSVLALAIEKKGLSMATLLLDHGANIDSCNAYGSSVLADAISRERFDVARLLLQRGANGKQCNIYGQPLLIVILKDSKISMEGKADLVELLLKNGANPNSTDMGWSTNAAIYYALEGSSSSPKVLQQLLTHGAKPEHEMSSGETLLLYAMDKGKKEEARLLLQYGADVNAKDKQGRLPLVQAVLNRDLQMIKLLRNHGAKVDTGGSTSVIDLARSLNQPEILDLLNPKEKH